MSGASVRRTAAYRIRQAVTRGLGLSAFAAVVVSVMLAIAAFAWSHLAGSILGRFHLPAPSPYRVLGLGIVTVFAAGLLLTAYGAARAIRPVGGFDRGGRQIPVRRWSPIVDETGE